ncbi:MAG: 50S ribosomal protein L10 [Cytophagales bacterium]|nr:MAG: 50S ribosomal protein L10 [Cytophagales bacterium]
MTKEEKTVAISNLSKKFAEFEHFYVTDSSALTVEQINKFRKFCFSKGVEYHVYKNTLIAKALETTNIDYTEFNKSVLKGASGLIFTSVGNMPGKLLKEFKTTTSIDKIVFKGASIDSSFFIGEKALDQVASLKSKNELIGDILGLLQSPAKNVISALMSGENKLAGIVKAIADKKESES